MPWSDVVDTALDDAIGMGTVDGEDEDQRENFIDAMYDAFRDDEGNFPDHFPNAQEVDKEQWGGIIKFFDEFGLWEDYREVWETYP